MLGACGKNADNTTEKETGAADTEVNEDMNNEQTNTYRQISVDEYQDTNEVQNAIFRAVSKCGNNIFTVGDVKQSIYKFRLARPEIFLEKYHAYVKEDTSNIRIDLHKNFRSRQEVLDFTNDIFYKIMATDLGNVAYDDVTTVKYRRRKDFFRDMLFSLNISNNSSSDLSK